MKQLPPEVDQRLVFRSQHCPGRHFLLGNSHTFPGRMAVWCEDSEYEISASLFEMTDVSEAARFWITGFLAGSEIRRPDEGDPASEASWEAARRKFHETGEWPRDDH